MRSVQSAFRISCVYESKTVAFSLHCRSYPPADDIPLRLCIPRFWLSVSEYPVRLKNLMRCAGSVSGRDLMLCRNLLLYYYIRRYRDCCSLHLTAKSKNFIAWELSGHLIDQRNQGHGVLPYLQVFVRTHHTCRP